MYSHIGTKYPAERTVLELLASPSSMTSNGLHDRRVIDYRKVSAARGNVSIQASQGQAMRAPPLLRLLCADWTAHTEIKAFSRIHILWMGDFNIAPV